MKQKIIVPAVSVGLFVTARQAIANVIDFGVVAESLSLSATFTGNTVQNTIGGYTFGGLTFVGSHLNDVINGNTVTNLLTQLLGPEQGLTLTFNFPEAGGASGNFTINGVNLLAANNSITVSENPMTGTLTSCAPFASSPLRGCLPAVQDQFNPFDPAGFLESLEAADVLSLAGPSFGDGSLVEVDKTNTITLGSFNGTSYIGEEIVTTDSISAAATPEPAAWSLSAIGAALLAWWRRR